MSLLLSIVNIVFIISNHDCHFGKHFFLLLRVARLTMGKAESKTVGVELDENAIKRLTKNTNYTPEQIRQWHEAFLRDCPSGKLVLRQFRELYKKFYPEYEADKYSDQVFRTFDTDNNGYIDFVEFLIAVNVNSNGDTRDKLGLAFDVYDINGNGQVRIEAIDTF